MPRTNYLQAGANPATNYLGQGFSFQTDFLDDGADAVIGAVAAEDSQAMGLVPQYGAENVLQGKTPAIAAAQRAIDISNNNAKQLADRAHAFPSSGPRLVSAANLERAKAKKIADALEKSKRHRHKLLRDVGPDTTAAVMGAGDLSFQVQSPPGIGRLTRVPFQVSAAVGAAPLSVPGGQPVVIAAGTPTPTTVTLQTPQLPWMIYRLVAVEAQVTVDAPGAGAPDIYHLLNLSTGNGMPLFGAAGNQPVAFYLQGLEFRGGLRDSPLVRAPNFLQVQVQVQNAIAGAVTTAGTTIVSVEAVCDVLTDDEYGAHLPGPYARPEALIRKPVGMI